MIYSLISFNGSEDRIGDIPQESPHQKQQQHHKENKMKNKYRKETTSVGCWFGLVWFPSIPFNRKKQQQKSFQRKLCILSRIKGLAQRWIERKERTNQTKLFLLIKKQYYSKISNSKEFIILKGVGEMEKCIIFPSVFLYLVLWFLYSVAFRCI